MDLNSYVYQKNTFTGFTTARTGDDEEDCSEIIKISAILLHQFA